jgi:fatty acid desaturase
MNPAEPANLPEPTLLEFTANQRKGVEINWYRTPLPKAEVKEIYRRSDAKALVQTLGYLAIYAGTAAASILAVTANSPWWLIILCVFLHGTVAAFMINGVHELGHGTVFKTKWLNQFFVHILAFLGWINHEKFQCSHLRHHRYTLHPPDDLEVVLPIRLMVIHFLKNMIVNPKALVDTIGESIRLARGKFKGDWELTLFPPDKPDLHVPTVRWARIMLAGHATILIVSLLTGQWIIPILLSAAPAYGQWLFFLCNNTQHIGLRDNVSDFRLCCRTFTLNPVVRFLYWQMNYHTEHHMYAAVPCYNLGKLHRLIRHELPPSPRGIIGVWKEIAYIQKQQETDPDYDHLAAWAQSAAT